MNEIKPEKIIEQIKNKKTGEQYMSEEEWKAKGVPEEDWKAKGVPEAEIRRDIKVIMPSLDLLGKTK